MNDAWELISTYSREEAIEDGVLVDVTAKAKEAGFKVPTAISAGLWRYVEPSADDMANNGQSIDGRLWDIFMLLRFAIGRADRTDMVTFEVVFLVDGKMEEVEVWGHIGPGDDGEAVLTIMRPEDY